ncbi:DUF916 and DUF3324 domain-containing protein [Lactiplantibacillus plantarum]|nr:DUF916 and DUF3324 domain-containing protein [Lactiplantibacillus plantarum]
MNGWNKKLLLGMLTLIMTLLAGMTVIGHAADTANNAVTFDVQPMLNEKQQLSKDAYYWDFKIQPKRTYSLAMRVNNRSNHEIKVKNQFLQSYTNAKGVIDYGAANLNDDTSLKVKLADIITVPDEETTIPANKSRIVRAQLKTPTKLNKGINLGSWQVKIADQHLKTKGATLTSEYAYNVGIKLTSNRDPLPKLRLADVQLKKRSGIKTVIGNIQNYHASILGKGTVTAYVSKAGQTKKLAVADLKSSSMAPNSNFDLPLKWRTNRGIILPGTYTLYVKYRTTDEKFAKPHVWSLKQDFVVGATDAVNVTSPTTWGWLIGIVLLVLLLIALIIFWVIKRRQNKR